MPNASDQSKESEEGQGQEKRSLQSTDAQKARTADKAAIQDIQNQNKDRWESEHGMFAIVDENDVVASKEVKASPSVDKQEMLASEENATRNEPVGGYEMVAQGDAQLLFKIGISNIETQVHAADSRDAGGTFKVIRPHTEREEALTDIEEDATDESVFEKVARLPVEQQIQVIGIGITSFQQELENQGGTIWTSTQRGVNRGVLSLVSDAETLVNSIGHIWQFGQDVMTNNPRAFQTAEETGKAIGKSIASGVKLWRMTERYLEEVGQDGTYAKPFNDLASLGIEINKRWEGLPPSAKAEVSSELLVKIVVPGAIGKLADSAKILERMEELGESLSKLTLEDKKYFCKKFGQLLDELFGPSKERRPAIATAGGQPQISEPGNALFSKRHQSERRPDDTNRRPDNNRLNSPFENLLISKVKSPDVVVQHHPNACVSACGEMLSEGKLSQRSLHEEMMNNFLPEMRKPNSTVDIQWLSAELQELDSSWRFRSFDPFDENLLRELLQSGRPWATEIRAYGKKGHAVVVDGLSKEGNIIIKDPEGFKYEIKVKDFINECWSGRSVVRGE